MGQGLLNGERPSDSVCDVLCYLLSLENTAWPRHGIFLTPPTAEEIFFLNVCSFCCESGADVLLKQDSNKLNMYIIYRWKVMNFLQCNKSNVNKVCCRHILTQFYTDTSVWYIVMMFLCFPLRGKTHQNCQLTLVTYSEYEKFTHPCRERVRERSTINVPYNLYNSTEKKS